MKDRPESSTEVLLGMQIRADDPDVDGLMTMLNDADIPVDVIVHNLGYMTF